MRGTPRGLCLGSLAAGLLIVLTAATSAVAADESWDAVYIKGAKVGHIHTYVKPVKEKGHDYVRVRFRMELTFKRQDDDVTMTLEYGTIEELDGTVVRLDTRTLMSNQEMRTFGDVIKNRMTLTLEGSGQRQQKQIAWGPDVRGPYGVEQSLARKPLKDGETRMLKVYMPDLNRISDITLTDKGQEEITLGDGKRSLRRVEQTASLDGQHRAELDVTFWVDPTGQVMKSSSDNFGGILTYRTTRDGALTMVGNKLDMVQSTIIKITHKIAKPESTTEIVYQLRLKGAEVAENFPADRRQSLRAGGTKDSARLVVRTAGPNDGAPSSERVDDEFLRPNALITSQDARVIQLAATAVENAVDPWEKTVRIVRWVAKNLKDKNFSTTFAAANEVAQTLSGDCSEHSVLVAAMCRAVGVPSRTAVGLVYAEPLGGFGYHMWDEVYVNRRWVAVNAAFNEISVDAVHIKMADSSLDGVSPLEAFLPVVRVAGKLMLDPIEVR